MHLCYIDESGTPDVPGNTSHYVLAGVSVPIWHWRDADREVSAILAKYGLAGQEFHTAWILRAYLEQSKIARFDDLSWEDRRREVIRYRNSYLLKLQQQQKHKTYKQVRKNYKHTSPYVHLSQSERRALVKEVAEAVSNWGFARLFAECIDKVYFDPSKTKRSISEQAFEQVVSRFEQYLKKIDAGAKENYFGLLVHDNNETVARKHTEMMRAFHEDGTLWTDIDRIIETPLFVDSRLTSMVQIADLCSYALRRFVENGEKEIFDSIFVRADRFKNTVVGVRHYTDLSCACDICQAHKQS